MEIKTTNMKIVDKMELNPVSTEGITATKELIGTNPSFRTVCFNFEEGKGLPDHVHNGYASIFIYEGKVDMEFESGEKFVLAKGDYLSFDARVRHKVIAKVQSKVFVTIAAPLREEV
ncbi:cupin domain-containing protein [uncultured Clostridium sp.]|uniref:cupin domain-containing protein n=1 Tax=uncultured Clostridium sp. TaxID=59620 RepID=UPI0025DFFE64|nr:cupin domain-containing protein [uncultured Clostridium sp.]